MLETFRFLTTSIPEARGSSSGCVREIRQLHISYIIKTPAIAPDKSNVRRFLDTSWDSLVPHLFYFDQ